MEQFGGTPSYNLPVNRHQVHKLAAPLEFFTALKGSTEPLLSITGLAVAENRALPEYLKTQCKFWHYNEKQGPLEAHFNQENGKT